MVLKTGQNPFCLQFSIQPDFLLVLEVFLKLNLWLVLGRSGLVFKTMLLIDPKKKKLWMEKKNIKIYLRKIHISFSVNNVFCVALLFRKSCTLHLRCCTYIVSAMSYYNFFKIARDALFHLCKLSTFKDALFVLLSWEMLKLYWHLISHLVPCI